MIKERSRLRNRLQTQTIPLLKRQSRARLTQVERQIIELDAEIAAIIGQEEGMAVDFHSELSRFFHREVSHL